MTHKKGKTNIIESDEDDNVDMDTSIAGISQSVKMKLKEKILCEVVAKQPGRRGRPPKVKKSQKSQNTSEADKIKELAEKLKKQMKEKQQIEAQQSNVSKQEKAKSDGSKQENESDTKRSHQGNYNLVANTETAASDKAKTKDQKVSAHTRKDNTIEMSQNQKTTPGANSKALEMGREAVGENPEGCLTERPVVTSAEKSSKKTGSSTNLDSLLNLQSEMLKPSGSVSSQGKKYISTGAQKKARWPVCPVKTLMPMLIWFLVWFLFYGPSTHFRSFRARSVNLATLFLGKSPRQFTST